MKSRSGSTSSRSKSRSGKASGGSRSKSLRVSRARTPSSARARSSKSSAGKAGGSAKFTTNHDEIRRWAEARRGMPSVVKRTHRPGEPEGLLRIDFPGFSGKGTLDHISWDEWFRIFDEHKLAFLYQERKANGEPSTFNKQVRRAECL